jgi:N-acetylglucosaminyldiphosphoundecaprenol N-acetyl-beta-D-mannosaminyltransferase
MTKLDLLGVTVEDATMREAFARLVRWLSRTDRTRSVYFVNAHTLNLASEHTAYRALLNQGDVVYGDGTGVRWAARIKGAGMRDNVNGSDLTPLLLERVVGRRLFLLGAAPEVNERAVEHCMRVYPQWEIAGSQHGFYERKDEERLVDRIREARPDLLLVAFGNPLQESFIHRWRERLGARVAMGVGGLLDYFGGSNVRAPEIVRELGIEWMHILARQPHKAGRYLIGNPAFLCRAVADRLTNGPAL